MDGVQAPRLGAVSHSLGQCRKICQEN